MRVYRLLLLWAALWVSALGIRAQEQLEPFTERYFLEQDYFRFYFPKSWQIVQDEDGRIGFENAKTIIIPVFDYENAWQPEDDISAEDPVTFLRYRMKAFYKDYPLDESKVQRVTVAEEPLIMYGFSYSENGTVYDLWQLIRFVDRPFMRFYLAFVVFPKEGKRIDANDLRTAQDMLAVAETWHVRDDGTADLAELYRFTVPEGWSVDVNDHNLMRVYLESTVAMFDYRTAQEWADARLAQDGKASLLSTLFDVYYDAQNVTVSPNDLRTLKTAGADVVRYDYDLVSADDEKLKGTLLLVDMADGSLVILDIFDELGGTLSEAYVRLLADMLGTMTVLDNR